MTRNRPVSEEDRSARKSGSVRWVLVLVALVVAVIFAAQNADVVTVRAFAWRFEASLAVIIVLCFAVGVLISLVALLPRVYKGRSHERRLSARIADLEARRPAATSSTPRNEREPNVRA